MKSKFKQFYEKFYIQKPDGQLEETTRAVCFAPAENPTAENPIRQEWFPDVEAGYIVRCARNEKGLALYRLYEESLAKIERHEIRERSCVGLSNKGWCDRKCDVCKLKRHNRHAELDKPIGFDDNGVPEFMEIADSALTPEQELEKKALSRIVEAGLAKITKQQAEIYRLRFLKNKSAAEVAEILGITPRAVNKAIQVAKPILAEILKKLLD